MNVVIADVKNLTSAKESLLEISNDESKVLIQECDVTSLDAVKELEIFVQESFGKVHCLMGNAGMIAMGTKPWEEVEQLHKIMNTNFMGVVNLCNAFIPSMIASW